MTDEGMEMPGRGLTPPDVDLERVWLGVASRVWQREPGPLERTAARLLRSPGLARALLTTPSLLVPWLVATVAVLATGVVATLSTGQPVVALAMPGIAAAGIAYAYGPGVDPAWELMRSVAVSDRMILLVRALAVLGVDTVLGVAASFASPVASGVLFGWLVPMTAASALALAAATVARSANAGMAAGVAGWTIMDLAAQSATGQVDAAVGLAALQVPYLICAAVCGVVAVLAARSARGLS